MSLCFFGHLFICFCFFFVKVLKVFASICFSVDDCRNWVFGGKSRAGEGITSWYYIAVATPLTIPLS